MANDLLQEGIAAFQAGDRARAKEILEQVVAAEPNNDNAWYYLAAAQTNMTQRKEYLRRVLSLNPDHPRARDVLTRMEADESAANTAPPAGGARRTPPVIPLNAARGRTPGEAASGGFVLPVRIPDAPARVDFATLVRDGTAILRSGLDILQRKPGAYSSEVNQATWWRFWLLVGTAAVIIAIFSTIQSVIANIQLASFLSSFTDQPRGINILGILLTLLLSAPLQMLVFYAGCYLSHYWASRQGVSVPLYQHSYTIAVPYMTAQVITAALGAVLSILGLGGIGALISFGLSLYALYIVSFGFDMLYTFRDPNQKWFTLGMFFLGTIVAGIIVGAIVSGLGVAGVVPFL